MQDKTRVAIKQCMSGARRTARSALEATLQQACIAVGSSSSGHHLQHSRVVSGEILLHVEHRGNDRPS